MSLRPVYKNETNTEARRKARGCFRDATDYASHAMMDAKLKVYYQQKARQLKLPNAYTAAITDFLRKAKAGAVTRSGFSGRKGDVVNIKVSKSVFKISSIKAILYSHRGKMLCEQIIKRVGDQRAFAFKFPDDFPDYASLKIITSDEPGDKAYTIQASEFIRKAWW